MRAALERGWEMRKVKVNKDELLVALKENREKHIREYQESVDGYKDMAIEEINRAMNRLKQRVEELRAGEVMRLHAVGFDLEVPKNHQKDYDQVIKMVEMSVENELELSSDEFACYVMDDWEWKPDFERTSMSYNKKNWR